MAWHHHTVRMLSTRDLADAMGVSESSLKRWVDAGRIVAARTEGGHRRIALADAVRFIRTTRAPVVRPELLGMPEITGPATAPGDDSFERWLTEGDPRLVRGWLLARYLAGSSIAQLCDGPVKAAMHAIGERWRHSDDGVFVEHRATDACVQAISALRAMAAPSATAPIALGGTPENDPYIVPSFMAAAVVESVGMRAVNLGPDTPVTAMEQAYDANQPKLVWISASAPVSPGRAKAIGRWLESLPASTVTLVGGRSHGPLMPYARVVDTMVELEAIASEIVNAGS